jgi:hypothetical protein
METKDLVGLILIPIALVSGTIVLSLSDRLRNASFFFMVAAFVISDKLDINLLSRQWYRGTTRGIEFSFVDVLAFSLLASLLLVPRPGQKRFYWPASLGFMLLYLGYECFSVAVSDPKLFGLFEISKTIRAIVVFLAAANFVRGRRELQILVLALACAVCLEGVFALRHKLVFHLDRATGTLDHANSLSMYLCLTGPILVAALNSSFSRFVRLFSAIAVCFAAVAVVLAVSRAGIPIFVLVMLGATLVCMTWKLSCTKILGTAAVVLGVGCLLALSWKSLFERFGEATVKEELDATQLENRAQYFALAGAILQDKVLGVGLNNWSYHVSKTYGARLDPPSLYEDYDDIPPSVLYSAEIFDWSAKYAPPAHNLGVITVGELGLPGLLIFAALWARWFWIGAGFLWRRASDPMYRIGTGIFFGTCGIFLQSLTEWVYRQTAILLTFHVLLGTLASLKFWRRQVALSPEESDYDAEEDAAALTAASPLAQEARA